jgi:uncharacterized cupredoxin-like copper-binding protein
LLAAAALAVVASGCGGSAQAIETTIAIHYSRFEPESITVPAGVPVMITLRNDDPIEHEWLVGDAAMHERHRMGTDPVHDTLPTELSIPAFETLETTVQFDEAGDYAYICHLPGHEQYGMVGTMHVVDS